MCGRPVFVHFASDRLKTKGSEGFLLSRIIVIMNMGGGGGDL